uniref:Retrovirus-related Pol polyprotein from transposon TNT 1-94 n=1 Tax=Rhizophora mucronata TaxID=61149 RepID=A0A2P2MB67_RHIMU
MVFAERKNRHLLEIARALMFSMHIPKYLWGETILAATYLINRMPTHVLNFATPLECFKYYFPDTQIVSTLPHKVFGCTTYVHISHKDQFKLDPKTEKYIFIGYAANKEGYKYFNPLIHKIVVIMDVMFLENQLYFQNNFFQGKKLYEKNSWNIQHILPKALHPHPIVPCMEESLTGGETLPNNSEPEVIIYIRKKSHKYRESSIPEATPRQSKALDLGDVNFPQSSSPSIDSSSIPNKFAKLEYNDLNILIFIRKGNRSCTNHPITKYMLYDKLSYKHKAFT